MIAYFDSSSIVKWFFDEPLSEMAGDIKDSSKIAVTSLIAFPEVMSAFNRAFKDRRCTQSELDKIRTGFLRIWSDFQRVAITEHLVRKSETLIFKHNLKGFDSLHLASAIELKAECGTLDIFFSCFDKNLNAAARREGFLIHGA